MQSCNYLCRDFAQLIDKEREERGVMTTPDSSALCTDNPQWVLSGDDVVLHWITARLHHPTPIYPEWAIAGRKWKQN